MSRAINMLHVVASKLFFSKETITTSETFLLSLTEKFATCSKIWKLNFDMKSREIVKLDLQYSISRKYRMIIFPPEKSLCEKWRLELTVGNPI